VIASHVRCRLITGSWLVAVAASIFGLSVSGPIARGEGPKPKARDVVLRGKVVPLVAALNAVAPDLKPDPKPIAEQVVLLGGDGSIVPLVPDEAARALFQDERLRNRPVEIRGRRLPGLPYVQVVTLKVELDGRLRTPEYYCHICSISLRHPQTCPCCQGPMELRMKPEVP
jgi:hypothetical protein